MLRFSVHVHPGARASRVGGDYDGALNVHVRARAVDGAATAQVLSVLAEAFDVRVGAVHLLRGAHSRTKSVEIEGDEAALSARLAQLLGT
jgi:hypothetical protein